MSPEQPLHSENLDHAARRIVSLVAALNLLGFVIELMVAGVIGSASLFADAADFLEDFLINFLVLAALGWSVASRQKASYWLAGLVLIPAVAALGMAGYKAVSGQPPEPWSLSVTAVGAALLNLVCAALLLRLRRGQGALVRGAWLAARNDVLANVLILLTGLVTVWWSSAWPDVIVGVIVALVNFSAAKEVLEQARADDPEIE